MRTAVLPLQTLSLRDTALSLRRLIRSRFSLTVDKLVRLRNFAAYAACLNELKPETFREMAGEGVRLAEIPDDISHPIENEAQMAIGEELPIGYGIEELSVGETQYFFFGPQGFIYTWDDWYEALDNPDDLAQRGSIYVFCKFLETVESDPPGDMSDIEAIWDQLSEHFGWHCPLVNLSGMLDEEKFFKKLDKAGLGDWKLMFQISYAGTGNFFIDFDGENPEYLTVSLENLRTLIQQYDECEKIQLEYDQVLAATDADPGIFQRVAKLFSKCLERPARVRTDGRVTGGRTLVEIFGEEEAEAHGLTDFDPNTGEGATIIDEFYGPIG